MTNFATADRGRMAAVFAPLSEIERILQQIKGYVVIANINRYSTRPLHIADAQTAALTFTGTVRPEALDGWLRALGKIQPVRVTIGDDAITLASSEQKPR